MRGLLLPTILLLFNLWSFNQAYSQGLLKKNTYELEAGAYISSTKNLPFWLHSNQYGEIPLQSNVLTLRGQMEKEYNEGDFKKQKLKKWSYGYKVRAVANVGKVNQLLIPEIYFKTKFKAFEFYVGRKKEIFGLTDTTLGSGSYIWSGNALPIPKIQIAIPNYIPILKNKLISVKGNFSHGWFGSADSTKNYFLHQKSIYFRIGKPFWKINLHAGLNHQVQWGGSPTKPFIQGGSNAYISKYGSDLEAYFYVLTGKALIPDGKYVSGQFSGEGGNRSGNHLGTIDFAIEFNNSFSNILLYKQSIYEDGSLAVLSNVNDGLYGISLTKKGATKGLIKINFELLDTRNQGGELSALGITTPQLRGQDDYFNNATYEEGWVYKKNTIGTAFLMPISNSPFLSSKFGSTKINPNYILNNRVKAYSIGIYSKIKSVELKTRVSLSENLGSYLYAPFNVKQLSIMQQISFPVKKYFVHTNIGYDNSGLFDKNLGIVFLIKRYF
ncbi:capsule assembly Wzi family protein [Emticicia sp.]|uniref:capsule assembly Wzi family protein n=1 Tax=Emticicia sp. TaxID=1930953 RepID=UPI00375240C1